MAPEVINGDKATTASDVFSLGITLHEIFFGRRPEWQITQSGKLLKSPVGARASTREKAFASLCVECLTEFAPKRLQDAAAVRRRFDQAVGGRLQPLRGRLRGRWPLVVGAGALCAAFGVTIAARRHSDALSRLTSDLPLVGRPNDLSLRSKSLLTSDRRIDCFDLLPGGRAVRVVFAAPAKPIDVDLVTGGRTPAPLSPVTFAVDCPRLSPDGQRLLFTTLTPGGPRIMLSRPDGGDAQTVTEGSFPVWLPSGNEFVYTFDRSRGAVFSLPQTRMLFADTPPLEKHILDIAVSATGNQVAFLFADAKGRAIVEIYQYPGMSLVRSARFKGPAYFAAFDGKRRSVLLTVGDLRKTVLTEITASEEIARIGDLPSTSIGRVVRSPFGLAFFSSSVARSVEVELNGAHRTIHYSGAYSRPTFSESGDALLETRLDDGRLVIALQRWNDPTVRVLTSGPEDAYPSFALDGKSFTYVRIAENAIMTCRLDGDVMVDCREIAKEPFGPRAAVLSPDGKSIGYATAYGATGRLRVLSTSGTQPPRDIGAFSSDCPLVWSAPEGLAVYQGDRHLWEEFDRQTGRPTGRSFATSSADASACNSAPRYHRGAPLDIQRSDKTSVEVRLSAAY
jgi:hypothetical protein